MGFSKRYFSQSKIKELANNYPFEMFDKLITGVDSVITTDEFSKKFMDKFFTSDVNVKKEIYNEQKS